MIRYVHGLLTAATVCCAIGITGLGVWLHLALGRRPMACVDDLSEWSFQVASHTAAMLFVVALLGAPAWVASSLAEAAAARSRSALDQSLLLARLIAVATAWTLLVVDPTGGFEWFMD